MRSPQAFEIAGFSASNRNCSSAVGMTACKPVACISEDAAWEVAVRTLGGVVVGGRILARCSDLQSSAARPAIIGQIRPTFDETVEGHKPAIGETRTGLFETD